MRKWRRCVCGRVHHVLFICGRNQSRSPTAEHLFASYPGLQVASAGVDNDSDVQLSPELVSWADTIFVMQRSHREKLSRRYRKYLKSQRIINLNIPDDYDFMDHELIRLLTLKVPRHL